jgi:hypothetical protein
LEAVELIGNIIEAHETANRDGFSITENIKILPQLNYTGKMARKAYSGYRKGKNAGRLYCGILDFKIVFDNQDTEHEKHMIGPTIHNLTQDITRRIHDGDDPLKFTQLTTEQKDIACCLQAAFVEQEVNWGIENFQLWTRFGDPQSIDDLLRLSAPRDFLSVFLERCYTELHAGKGWGSIAAEVIAPFRQKSFSAGSNVLMPPIKNKKVVVEFRESMPCSIHKKRSSLWIVRHLQRIADFCEMKGVNPLFSMTYT